MTDLPPLFLHSAGRFGALYDTGFVASGGLVASTSLGLTVQQCLYMPFYLPWTYPIKRMYVINGTSVSGAGVDVGIYSAGGTKLLNGTFIQAGTSTLQYVSVNATPLLPGRYYFGITVTGTSGGYYTYSNSSPSGGGDWSRHFGLLAQNTTYPLPAVMAPTAGATPARYPLVGMTLTGSGF